MQRNGNVLVELCCPPLLVVKTAGRPLSVFVVLQSVLLGELGSHTNVTMSSYQRIMK